MENTHKAGFVNIVGRPNVGKSTLMNQLVGERLSIITSKAQTTRHRIMGILNGEDFQIIYSDTPGILKPQYELHEAMMGFVRTSVEDADVLLVVTEVGEKYEEEAFKPLKKAEGKIIFIINKIDQAKGTQVDDKLTYWKQNVKADHYIALSALDGVNIDTLFNTIIAELPEHPPFYPKDELTDKPERFFVSEIIREKIFLNYKKEVPYSSEVIVEEFKESDDIIRIRAIIYVERKTQKGIIIGKGGEAIKKVGIEARKDLEDFFKKQVYLETFVKVADNWRKVEGKLKQFGYRNK